MGMVAAIERKLAKGLAPSRLSVIDESDRHAGHAGARPGGETHFRVEIVSAAFRDKSSIERQRMVYALVAQELASGLHALSVKAMIPEEDSAA